jgi:hypothetical protein
MMVEVTPEAYFDNLVLAGESPSSIMPMSVVELHLYSYLGCILALFRGQPIGDWGYGYSVTSEGFPFSAELEEARRVLSDSGVIEVDEVGLIRPNAKLLDAELTTVLSLSSWEERRLYLRTATECALALPVGSIRYAINQTPGVVQSLALNQRRRLLDDDDVSLLYEEYKVVRSVVGESHTLSPAVVWLSARIMRTGEMADAI